MNEDFENEGANDGFENTNENKMADTVEIVEKSQKQPINWKREVLDWVFSIVIALVIALVIRNYVFTFVKVDGSSMNPTLTHGDTLFVRRCFYTPNTNDIIILHPPQSYDTPYVKRIVALEGQVVDIDAEKGTISVDGETLNEDYVTGPLFSGGNMTYPYTVPKDHVFVMGDNRTPGGSTDSRIIGPIPIKNIMGKAQFRILPISSIGSLYKDK